MEQEIRPRPDYQVTVEISIRYRDPSDTSRYYWNGETVANGTLTIDAETLSQYSQSVHSDQFQSLLADVQERAISQAYTVRVNGAARRQAEAEAEAAVAAATATEEDESA